MSDQIKKFEGPARDPNDQFQIGDSVIYLPEGIYGVIEGYIWAETIGELPRVISYRLSCGISVRENSIAIFERIYPTKAKFSGNTKPKPSPPITKG